MQEAVLDGKKVGCYNINMISKKGKAVLSALCALFALTVCSAFFTGCTYYEFPDVPPREGYLRTEDIRIRDISVLVADGKYYMYGMYPCSLEDGGYACYVSDDLLYWEEEPHDVFLKTWDGSFEGTSCFWAPEVHEYKGRYYLFGSYQSAETGRRGTSVFVADDPLGPFEELSDGHITPHEWNCIDGTLYVDEDGVPWMAFVHEWVDEGEGSMCVVRLSDDLSRTEGEVKTVFCAKDPFWSDNKVTDAPYFYKTSGGELLMIWSNSDLFDNYAIGIARSDNGRPDGEWSHDAIPLYSCNFTYAEDGGHGVIFEDLNGDLVLGFHSPGFVEKEGEFERAYFYRLEDTGDSLAIAGRYFE